MLLGMITACAALVVPAAPADAHRDPVSFAWVSSAGAVLQFHTPAASYRHHDFGWGIVSFREGTGLYTIRFYGLGAELLTLGHVRVTAYGTNPTSCQVRGWSGDEVRLACFDASGTPADSAFTVAYFDAEEDHTDEYAWFWSQHPSTPSFLADPLYAANGENAQLGANYSVTRLGTGAYAVDFPVFGVFESTPGLSLNVQVGAYGPAFARCKLDGFDEDTATVRCQNAAGLPQDSRFVLLAAGARSRSEGFATARIDDGVVAGGTLPVGLASVPSGDAVDWTRQSVGSYRVTFNGYADYGINGGTAHATANGSNDVWCKVASWTSDSVSVRCFDHDGTPSDSPFTVFYHKTPRQPFNQEYAFGSADQPATASYPSAPERTHSASGGAVGFARSGIGVYTASFAGMGSVGSDGGIVLASMSGAALGHCKPVVWGGETATIRCYDDAGFLADRPYDVLYWKPTDGAQGVAYAWGSQPTTASYAPLEGFAHNPTGGPMAIDRLGIGRYAVTWEGYGATILSDGAYTGHPQVNAYGPGSHRCNTGPMHPDGDTIEVFCFDVSGDPVDSQFVALYVKSNRFFAGVHYGRGFAPPAIPNYTTANRYFGFFLSAVGIGQYEPNFFDLAPSGVGAQWPHVQVAAREGTDLRCKRTSSSPYKATTFLMHVDCWNVAGAPADAHYDLMFVTPQAVPEPGGEAMIIAGAGLLAAVGRWARIRRPAWPARQG